MKSFISLLFASLLFIGCNENLNQPQDISMFEKRTPVTNRDSVKNRVPLQKALGCLNLTREQKYFIDSVLKSHKQCEVECKKEFNDSVQTLRGEYKAKLSQYRGQEKDSLIRKEIEIINFEFRQTLRDLENEYKLKMKECNKYLYSKIEGVLNEGQLILWKQWKETGKLPCDRIKG